MSNSSPHSVQDDFFIVWATLKGHPTLDPHAALRRIEEHLEELETLRGARDRLSQQVDELLREVITDWSRDTREWLVNVGDAEQALKSLFEQLEIAERRERYEQERAEKWHGKYVDLVEQLAAKERLLDLASAMGHSLEEQFDALYQAVRLLPRPDLRSGSPYADGVRNNDLAVIWRAMDSISKRDEQNPASKQYEVVDVSDAGIDNEYPTADDIIVPRPIPRIIKGVRDSEQR